MAKKKSPRKKPQQRSSSSATPEAAATAATPRTANTAANNKNRALPSSPDGAARTNRKTEESSKSDTDKSPTPSQQPQMRVPLWACVIIGVVAVILGLASPPLLLLLGGKDTASSSTQASATTTAIPPNLDNQASSSSDETERRSQQQQQEIPEKRAIHFPEESKTAIHFPEDSKTAIHFPEEDSKRATIHFPESSNDTTEQEDGKEEDVVVNEGRRVVKKEERHSSQTEPEPDPHHLAWQPLYPCTSDFLKDFWHASPVVGFHIACLTTVQKKPGRGQNEGQLLQLELKLYRNALQNNEQIITPSSLYWAEIKRHLESNFDLHDPQAPPPRGQEPRNFQPYALFSPEGRRLADGETKGGAGLLLGDDEEEHVVDILLDHGVFLLFEGGQWLWPGVHVGFQRQGVSLYSVMPHGMAEQADKNRTVTITTLALEPLVVSIDGFLSDEECDEIQRVAEPQMEYSEVVLMDHDAGRPASDFRTSQSAFVQSRGNAVLQDIDDRVASLTRLPRNHQEYVQVLRYGVTEKYDHHTDYFDPSLYQNDAHTLQNIGHGRRNRLATVFWYLTTVPQGGETAFPGAHGLRVRDMTDCSPDDGKLLVKPERGKVIIFYSLLMSGKTDPKSIHGACPVKEGIKWAANKWVWNERMGYVR